MVLPLPAPLGPAVVIRCTSPSTCTLIAGFGVYDHFLVDFFAVVSSVSSRACELLPLSLLLKRRMSVRESRWKPCSPPLHRSPVKVLVTPVVPPPLRIQTVAPVVFDTFVRQS